MSITKHLRALAHETRASIRLAGDFRSWWRLFRDIIRRRLTRVARVRDVTARRMVNLKGGVRIAYRQSRAGFGFNEGVNALRFGRGDGHVGPAE